MGTQKGGYHTKDGTRVPSVTTITSRFKESGGLVHWAWQLGKDGIDYRTKRDDAANAGTLAHEMVEAWVRKTECVLDGYAPEIIEKATRAFGGFRQWIDQSRLQIVHTEMPLVSEKIRTGGTFDAITLDQDGKLALTDWKSSNALYADYLTQIAAYAMLWEENYPDQPLTGGYHIIRFSKDDGDFEHRWFGELEDAKQMFLLLRQAYELDAKLKKRLK